MTDARASARRPAGRPGRALRSLRWLVWTALVAAVIGSLALAAGPALAHPDASAAEEPVREPLPLRLGMRGPEVRALQRALRRHGVRVRADGAFGRVTRAAVRRVQVKLGLRATGVADLELLERLGLAPAPEEAPPPSGAESGSGAGAAAEPAGAADVAQQAGAGAGAGAVEAPGRQDVVEFARQLIGAPYRYAGAGPSGFDCSGFVLHVYEHFDVSMPRSSAEQYEAFPKVARSDLQPGDLVFFDGLGHDGIYVGGGRFIHSSNHGDGVKVSRLDGDWYRERYEGAVRPS
jgi:cell wall-associated NlpC family hydrolase